MLMLRLAYDGRQYRTHSQDPLLPEEKSLSQQYCLQVSREMVGLCLTSILCLILLYCCLPSQMAMTICTSFRCAIANLLYGN